MTRGRACGVRGERRWRRAVRRVVCDELVEASFAIGRPRWRRRRRRASGRLVRSFPNVDDLVLSPCSRYCYRPQARSPVREECAVCVRMRATQAHTPRDVQAERSDHQGTITRERSEQKKSALRGEKVIVVESVPEKS